MNTPNETVTGERTPARVIADDFIMTPTGPVALIKGNWFSVNGSSKNDIVDIRFKVKSPVTGEGNAPRELSDAVKRVLAFDPSAFGKSRRTVREPVKIEKPNVELFDDHTHNEA